ncbi:MAG: succinyl-diaminopimelate desuccinylase [Betaproteobacteria bacterium]|nr:succinyl-diaminopimelate desuccinylase [Betaproteobacteria bacterium]
MAAGPAGDATDDSIAQALLALLGDLIAIPSTFPAGNTEAIADYCARRLAAAGYAVQRADSGGVVNTVARIGSDAPSVVFNVHADTVEPGERGAWNTDPFQAQLIDGRIHGLGAGNCKGPMAVQLWLAGEVARRGGPKHGEIVFTFVGDEESLGPHGLKFLRDAGHVKPDILIVGAQTENQLVVEERGVMWSRITTRGSTAHAGMPHLGDNAILRMLRVLQHIETGLVPQIAARKSGTKQATLSVGTIAGGSNTNVVPGSCSVTIDRRLLPEENLDSAFAELRAVALAAGEPAGTVEVELLTGSNGFDSGRGGKGVAAFSDAIEKLSGAPVRFLDVVGVFDGRYFARDGIEIIDFGPGEGHEGHAPNESTPLAQLVQAARIQLQVLRKLTDIA